MKKQEADTFDTQPISATTVVAISSGLCQLLADVFALYVKTKNFRWHMSRPTLALLRTCTTMFLMAGFSPAVGEARDSSFFDEKARHCLSR